MALPNRHQRLHAFRVGLNELESTTAAAAAGAQPPLPQAPRQGVPVSLPPPNTPAPRPGAARARAELRRRQNLISLIDSDAKRRAWNEEILALRTNPPRRYVFTPPRKPAPRPGTFGETIIPFAFNVADPPVQAAIENVIESIVKEVPVADRPARRYSVVAEFLESLGRPANLRAAEKLAETAAHTARLKAQEEEEEEKKKAGRPQFASDLTYAPPKPKPPPEPVPFATDLMYAPPPPRADDPEEDEPIPEPEPVSQFVQEPEPEFEPEAEPELEPEPETWPEAEPEEDTRGPVQFATGLGYGPPASRSDEPDTYPEPQAQREFEEEPASDPVKPMSYEEFLANSTTKARRASGVGFGQNLSDWEQARSDSAPSWNSPKANATAGGRAGARTSSGSESGAGFGGKMMSRGDVLDALRNASLDSNGEQKTPERMMTRADVLDALRRARDSATEAAEEKTIDIEYEQSRSSSSDFTPGYEPEAENTQVDSQEVHGTSWSAEPAQEDEPKDEVMEDLRDLIESGRVKNLTATRLRRILAERDMKTTGRKGELIARLTSFVMSG